MLRLKATGTSGQSSTFSFHPKISRLSHSAAAYPRSSSSASAVVSGTLFAAVAVVIVLDARLNDHGFETMEDTVGKMLAGRRVVFVTSPPYKRLPE